ncbi:MAG: hypothetical protein HRU19_14610 [Pseudobacteriovorax sp.]|nr:hypothetical protein [Pseudobacteriovorax sp.]
MKYVIYIIFAMAGLDVVAETLPPIGKRVYHIDQDSLFRPVDIRPDAGLAASSSAIELRDPLGREAERNGRAIAPDLKLPVNDSAKISFPELSLQGRISKPRVSFTLDRLNSDPDIDSWTMSFRNKAILESTRLRALSRSISE